VAAALKGLRSSGGQRGSLLRQSCRDQLLVAECGTAAGTGGGGTLRAGRGPTPGARKGTYLPLDFY
jgi:hypothetical protein